MVSLKNVKTLIFTLLFGVFPELTNDIFAQACCSGGVPISNNIGIRPVNEKSISIRAIYDLNVLNSFYTGNEKLEDGSIKRLSQTAFLQGIYGINKRISINTMFSFVHHKRSNVDLPDQTTTSNGIGDATFLVQFKVLNREKTSLYITAGLKIPIGRNDLKNEDDILLAPDLQPGSGSWDYIAGMGFVQDQFVRKTMSLTLSLTSKINTYSERFYGNQQYKYGNDIQLLAGISDNYFIKDKLVNPGILFRFWARAEDLADGFVFPNTGGSWFFVVPSVNIGLNPDFSVFASFEIPVYQNLSGTQLSTSFRFAFGLQYGFSL